MIPNLFGWFRRWASGEAVDVSAPGTAALADARTAWATLADRSADAIASDARAAIATVSDSSIFPAGGS